MSLAIQLDKISYRSGEMITITGTVPAILEGLPVAVQVLNPMNKTYTIDSLLPNADRTFSTTIKIGGRLGINGIYTVKATYAGQTVRTTFELFGAEKITKDTVRVEFEGNVFNVKASLSNGSINSIEVDPKFKSLILSVNTSISEDGTLTITLPRQLLDTKEDGQDGVFIVLVDGRESDFQETLTTSTERSLRISVPAGAQDVEIIGTSVMTVVATLPEIIFDKTEYSPSDEVTISIISPNSNKNPDAKDVIKARVYSDKQDLGLLEFVETAPNSGIFERSIRLTPNLKAGGELFVSAGDFVTVEFQPEDQIWTNKANVDYHIGQVMFDKDACSPDEHMVVRVIDPDENKDPNAIDMVDVNVWSSTEKTGLKLRLHETGDRTGIFEEVISFTVQHESHDNTLKVSEGDTITVRYTDRTLPPAVYERYAGKLEEDLYASALILPRTEKVGKRRMKAREGLGTIIIEGSHDETFFDSLLEKVAGIPNLRSLAVYVIRRAKQQQNDLIKDLVTNRYPILAFRDIDAQLDQREALQGCRTVIENSTTLTCEIKDQMIYVNSGATVEIEPVGLASDADLRDIGITRHSMEDYLLKLIAIDTSVAKWCGLALRDLRDRSDSLKNLNASLAESKTFVVALDVVKGVGYDNLVKRIIHEASLDNVVEITKNLLKHLVVIED